MEGIKFVPAAPQAPELTIMLVHLGEKTEEGAISPATMRLPALRALMKFGLNIRESKKLLEKALLPENLDTYCAIPKQRELWFFGAIHKIPEQVPLAVEILRRPLHACH